MARRIPYRRHSWPLGECVKSSWRHPLGDSSSIKDRSGTFDKTKSTAKSQRVVSEPRVAVSKRKVFAFELIFIESNSVGKTAFMARLPLHLSSRPQRTVFQLSILGPSGHIVVANLIA